MDDSYTEYIERYPNNTIRLRVLRNQFRNTAIIYTYYYSGELKSEYQLLGSQFHGECFTYSESGRVKKYYLFDRGTILRYMKF
jgi:antitoxin component YwqK of YwqJK toxin-antitoxin module